jgi:hypothetical protein
LTEAIKFLEGYPSCSPVNLAHIFHLRGVAFARQNKITEAVQDYQKAAAKGENIDNLSTLIEYLQSIRTFLLNVPDEIKPFVALFPKDRELHPAVYFVTEALKLDAVYPLSNDMREKLLKYYLLHLTNDPSESAALSDSLLGNVLTEQTNSIAYATQHPVFLAVVVQKYHSNGWYDFYNELESLWEHSNDNIESYYAELKVFIESFGTGTSDSSSSSTSDSVSQSETDTTSSVVDTSGES